MIEQNRAELEKSGVLKFPGGKGVTMAHIDHGPLREYQKEYATCPFSTTSTSKHGANCVAVIHEVAPEANIILLPPTAEAIQYIIDHNIKLASTSLYASGGYPIFEPLKGKALLFACAGNNGDRVYYPAAYPWAIAVGAFEEPMGKPAYYSNPGPELDITAYTDIYIPNDNGDLFPFSGTSCATPFAAGMLACWLGACRQIGIEPTIAEMFSYVLANCIDVYSEGFDTKTGNGLFILPEELPMKINLTIGSKAAKINGEDYTLLTEPVVNNGTTLVPLRFISEGLGANVTYDGKTKGIEIVKL